MANTPVIATPTSDLPVPPVVNTLNGTPLPTLNGPTLTAAQIVADIANVAEIIVDNEVITED